MKKSFVLCAAFALALPAFAGDIAGLGQSEEKELADLLSIVQQETDVATKTRLNSDYVPGIVTVLEGDELEALGIRTAGEALGLVPGMMAMVNDRAANLIVVRGLDFPFNVGNIQVLLNGIAVARQDGGFNTAALMVPVEQIDRIEVIRGPGSVIYGDFAFMGLVNIITRKQGIRAALRTEVPHDTMTSALRVGSKTNAPLTWSANVSRMMSGDTVAVEPQRLINEHRTFAVGNVAYRGFSLTAQAVQRDYEPRNATAVREKTWDAEARYTRELRPTLRAEATLTQLHNDSSDPVDILTGDLTRLGVNATWTGLARQSWLIGADHSRSGLDDAFHAVPPPPGQPPGLPQLLAHDVHRNVTGVVLQDQINVNEALTVTAGGRYDRYSDLDSRFTPRLALVWRVGERHILKAQYAEGFRPPTFFELYTRPAPGTVPRYPFEVNATSELNYVYRHSGRVGRVTLFHSKLSDMLRPGGVVVNGDATAEGAELEWTQELGSRVKLGANASFADTFDPRVPNGGGANRVSSRWLGNTTLLFRAMPTLVFGGRFLYVGRREAGNGFRTIDLSVSRQDLFVPGLALRAGIKNFGDSDVSYLFARPNGTVNTSHWPGRSAWVQVSWKG